MCADADFGLAEGDCHFSARAKIVKTTQLDSFDRSSLAMMEVGRLKVQIECARMAVDALMGATCGNHSGSEVFRGVPISPADAIHSPFTWV